MGNGPFTGGLGATGARTGYKKARKAGLQRRFTQTWDDLINSKRTANAPIQPGDSVFSAAGTPSSPNNRYASAGGTGSSSGGSGSGGSGSGTGGTGSSGDPAGTSKFTGTASQYAPGLTDILYQNPEIFVRDTLKSMGYNADSGIMDLLGNDAGNLQALAMLTGGSQPGSLNSQENNEFINFANDWVKNSVTPGGYGIDSSQMLQTILDSPDGSALAAALTSGTPQDQANMLNNMVGVAAGGMTPLMQSVLGKVMNDRTTDWLSTQAKGSQASNFADWLQQGGGGILGR